MGRGTASVRWLHINLFMKDIERMMYLTGMEGIYLNQMKKARTVRATKGN